MPPRNDYKIIKVPLNNSPKNYPQSFPRMPRLYCELLENKKKIKQDLINKEHISSSNLPSSLFPNVDEGGKLGDVNNDYSKEEYKNSIPEPEISKTPISISSIESDRSEDNNNQFKVIKESFDNKDSQDISDRLKELLSADDLTLTPSKPPSKPPPQPFSPNILPTSSHTPANKIPTLAELEQKGQFTKDHEFRDINLPSPNEEELEDKKRELMFKFDLLKRSYPNSAIPEFSIHSDYNVMRRSYDNSVRKLSLDSTVDTYKSYLIGGFMLVEFILGHFFKFEMTGFTQQQVLQMNNYERLLIELGEKSYVPDGSKWPVELRLLFLIIMNAAFFIVSKMIMRKTGANVMGMINSVTKVSSGPPSTTKKKMKGPMIDIDDI